MYLTIRQQVKHLDQKQFQILKDLSHTAKNLANEALYLVRQTYFSEHRYIGYQQVYAQLKTSPNYRKLNSNMAQQILMEIDGCFKSFFGLLRLAEAGKYNKRDCRIPRYLPKDGYTTLVIGFVRTKGDSFVLPYSNTYKKNHNKIAFKIPPLLQDKKIKEIRIIPKAHASYFEIQYTYEAQVLNYDLDPSKALSIDPGIDNLITAVTSTGQSFIIDGRRLKSVNQWYNKENARLQSIKDKQKHRSETTRRQKSLHRRRSNIVNDYMSKTARKLIDYCIEHQIGNLVVGCNKDFQRSSNMGKVNNQNFVQIPYGELRQKLKYLCKMYGITYIEQEESYTSKASFWDQDEIPVYEKTKEQCIYSFSGKRIYRGMYRTSKGQLVNADINGALNILRKSNVVNLTILYSRGEVDTPVRIRIA